ncbi:marC integral membrane family protein [Mycobacteroides abscessus subsp. bolletii 1513]|uniref:UPF0056 membrane protein n=1 Tax=Mycobacteroides abscessus subsp. bolletii 1513 TaxID=1299321 RepID=X8DPD0_9MYCO|nr:marC integral membrane family protein [Mycobacteroides abscessus subsp. bolletii 1513]
MAFDIAVFTSVFITLVVIMDPPGAVPVFLSLTGRLPAPERHRAAWQAPAVSLTVISMFAIGGQAILEYLHIGVPALQGAGGLLLLITGLSLLMGGATSHDADSGVNVALVPLGTPLMAGPGPSRRPSLRSARPVRVMARRHRPLWPSPRRFSACTWCCI